MFITAVPITKLFARVGTVRKKVLARRSGAPVNRNSEYKSLIIMIINVYAKVQHGLMILYVHQEQIIAYLLMIFIKYKKKQLQKQPQV